MVRRIGELLLAAICLACLAGCAKEAVQEPTESWVIGVVTKSRNSEYWMSVCSGMEKAAEDRGVKVIILSPDTETDKGLQQKMIYDFIKRGVDALAVSTVDSYDNGGYVKEAREKGISVYAYDTPIMDVEVPYIGIDHHKVGYELALVLAGKLEHRGNVAVISGSIDQASHGQRVEGFLDYMSRQPNIRIDEVISGYSNLRVSEQEMETLLAEHPGLDGIMTTSAVTALGIAEATDGTGISIVTIDAQEDAVTAVEEGRITALGAQSGYDVGYQTICYIAADKNGDKLERERVLDIRILTEENVGEYQDLKK